MTTFALICIDKPDSLALRMARGKRISRTSTPIRASFAWPARS